ncbi:MAG: Na+/H+ antiporter subunit E, partial [Chloroflexota bacterium]
KGSVQVAACVAGLRTVGNAGVVRVPYGARTPRGVAVSGVVLTLAPGSVLVDLDDERREMIVHAIDASDPQAVIDGIQAFYERWQRRVFP